MTAVTFAEPASISAAQALLAADPSEVTVVAGGTAVVLMMRQRLLHPTSLVSIREIPELHGVEVARDIIGIGATTTLSEVSASPVVRTHAPSVAVACGLVGNPRVRNAATVGGNLAEADYASDPPAALAAVGARCHVVGPTGERTVGVAELATGFYETVLEPDELIVQVELPVPTRGRRETYLKYKTRSSEDRACVGVAARLDLVDGRIADVDVVVTAVAPTLQRVPEALTPMVGTVLDDRLARSVAQQYAEAIEPMDDARGSAWYRRQMIQVFVRRALLELADEQGTAR